MESKRYFEWTIRGFRNGNFANGTIELGKYIAAYCKRSFSLGGGDSVAAVKQLVLRTK
jgi:3-phosphoglycerate kinase